MRYGVLFLLAAFLLGMAAAYLHSVFWWPAVSFAWVATGYFVPALGARVFGKTKHAHRRWWRLPLAGPVIVFMALLRRVLLVVRHNEPDWNEVAPGFYVGRRISPSALPPDVATVVDLTSEFLPIGNLPSGTTYRCLPMLDGHIPEQDTFLSFSQDALGWPSPLYIHCAAGHGRSAMLAAFLMVRQGIAPNIHAAETVMKRARPAIHLNRVQRRFVETLIDER